MYTRGADFLQISYRVTRVSKVVDETVEILYGAIALVQFDLDLSDVIENEKVDNFLCSILNMATAVTICLAECIAVVMQIRNGKLCQFIQPANKVYSIGRCHQR